MSPDLFWIVLMQWYSNLPWLSVIVVCRTVTALSLVHPTRRSPASSSSTAGYGWRDYRGVVKYEVGHYAVAVANKAICQLLPRAQVREHHDKRTFNSVYAPANTLNLKHPQGVSGVGKGTWLGGGRLYRELSATFVSCIVCSNSMKTVYDQSCCASVSCGAAESLKGRSQWYENQCEMAYHIALLGSELEVDKTNGLMLIAVIGSKNPTWKSGVSKAA